VATVRGDGTLLRVRLDRLAAAADNAIAAARAGDFGEMRQYLRRFDTLTSAIWTVQDAVFGSRRIIAADAGCSPSGGVTQADLRSPVPAEQDQRPCPAR